MLHFPCTSCCSCFLIVMKWIPHWTTAVHPELCLTLCPPTKYAKRYCPSWSRLLLHVFTADRCKESLRLWDIPHVFRHVSCLFQAWYTRGPARDVDLREGTSGAEDAGFGNDKPFVDFIIISQMSFCWLIKILRRPSEMIHRYRAEEIDPAV